MHIWSVYLGICVGSCCSLPHQQLPSSSPSSLPAGDAPVPFGMYRRTKVPPQEYKNMTTNHSNIPKLVLEFNGSVTMETWNSFKIVHLRIYPASQASFEADLHVATQHTMNLHLPAQSAQSTCVVRNTMLSYSTSYNIETEEEGWDPFPSEALTGILLLVLSSENCKSGIHLVWHRNLFNDKPSINSFPSNDRSW